MANVLHTIKAYLYDNSLTDNFDSPTEGFNPQKHSILFQFNQGETLRSELSTVTVEILDVAESGTFVAQVTDVKSCTVNDLLTNKTPNSQIIFYL